VDTHLKRLRKRYPCCSLDSSPYDIRILQWVLSKFENDSTARCQIVPVNLDEIPEYDVLPYTCGNLRASRTIVVDDMEVSVGLYFFVARNNIHESNSSLGVDSLPVDQDNQRELSAAAAKALLHPPIDLARTLARLYDWRFKSRRAGLIDYPHVRTPAKGDGHAGSLLEYTQFGGSPCYRGQMKLRFYVASRLFGEPSFQCRP
jgi:hypothetical protein